MAALPLPPDPPLATSISLDDFRDSEVTAPAIAPSVRPAQAQVIAELATAVSRLETLVSATWQAYDDTSHGRTSDLPRKSQRVTDLLVITRDTAKQTLALAYELLADSQRS